MGQKNLTMKINSNISIIHKLDNKTMKSYLYTVIGPSILTLSSCASIDFGGDGLTYYDPKPSGQSGLN